MERSFCGRGRGTVVVDDMMSRVGRDEPTLSKPTIHCFQFKRDRAPGVPSCRKGVLKRRDRLTYISNVALSFSNFSYIFFSQCYCYIALTAADDDNPIQ